MNAVRGRQRILSLAKALGVDGLENEEQAKDWIVKAYDDKCKEIMELQFKVSELEHEQRKLFAQRIHWQQQAKRPWWKRLASDPVERVKL
jgi:hypothetical protein